LSPEKVTRSAPAAIASRGVGSCGRPQAVEVDQRAAAEVDRRRAVVLVRQRGSSAFGHGVGEALDRVVAGMHLHQQRGARPDGFREVLEVGAVGGADLDQLRPGALHDVRHAEGAADLDQLAARDDDLLASAPGC
jgi:hypothetical protein